MKLQGLVFGIGLAIALPTLGSASVLSWDFRNDVGIWDAGKKVMSPWSFTDLQGAQTAITASSNTKFLFEKNQMLGHAGLGVFDHGNNEIGGDNVVTLDFSDVLAFNPKTISIQISSMDWGDAASLSYGKWNQTTVTRNSPYQLNLDLLRSNNGRLSVEAEGCDSEILIGGVTAVTPEPASVGLMGLAGAVATFFGLRRRKRSN